MPAPTTTSRRDGDVLVLARAGSSFQVDLAALDAAWLLRVGDGFAGPDDWTLVLACGDAVVPVALSHPSVWRDLLPDLRRLAAAGTLYRADAAALPPRWLARRAFGFASADALPAPRPRAELERERARWVEAPLPDVPETLP